MSGVESRVPIGMDREVSRQNFLKKAAWTGAAFSAMGIGGFGIAVSRAEAQAQAYESYQGLGDAAILQFAYLLEQLEGVFYDEGVNAGLFKGAFLDQVAVLELAATLEPVGIGASQGAAPALESKDILAAAISIHNAECQHRAAINILNLISPPNQVAFEEALPLEDVQAAVEPFGITG